jgi:hypothetical protein
MVQGPCSRLRYLNHQQTHHPSRCLACRLIVPLKSHLNHLLKNRHSPIGIMCDRSELGTKCSCLMSALIMTANDPEPTTVLMDFPNSRP